MLVQGHMAYAQLKVKYIVMTAPDSDQNFGVVCFDFFFLHELFLDKPFQS